MTILYQTPIMAERSAFIAVASLIMACIFFGVSLCLMAMEKWKFMVISLIAVMLCVVGIAYGSYKVPSGKNRYEVLFDDSYPVEDLYKNYCIVDQRGKIYVLEDIERIE